MDARGIPARHMDLPGDQSVWISLAIILSNYQTIKLTTNQGVHKTNEDT